MRAKRVSFDRLVSPISIASVYLKSGKYRARLVKIETWDHAKNKLMLIDWVSIYSGREKVWSCNPNFFQHNFINVDKD